MFDTWLAVIALAVLFLNWHAGILLLSGITVWLIYRTGALFLIGKWRPVEAAVSGSEIHGSGEETVLLVTAFFTLNGETHCVTIRARPTEKVLYPFGSHIRLLVSPRKPDRYIIDRAYSGNFEWFAYWLATKLLQLQGR